MLVLEFPLELGILNKLSGLIRKYLSYHKAIGSENPYWNGYEWVEWGDDSDIPF